MTALPRLFGSFSSRSRCPLILFRLALASRLRIEVADGRLDRRRDEGHRASGCLFGFGHVVDLHRRWRTPAESIWIDRLCTVIVYAGVLAAQRKGVICLQSLGPEQTLALCSWFCFQTRGRSSPNGESARVNLRRQFPCDAGAIRGRGRTSNLIRPCAATCKLSRQRRARRLAGQHQISATTERGDACGATARLK